MVLTGAMPAVLDSAHEDHSLAVLDSGGHQLPWVHVSKGIWALINLRSTACDVETVCPRTTILGRCKTLNPLARTHEHPASNQKVLGECCMDPVTI
eukprot:1143529-Pelagomonas_calceolata.AAC.3